MRCSASSPAGRFTCLGSKLTPASERYRSTRRESGRILRSGRPLKSESQSIERTILSSPAASWPVAYTAPTTAPMLFAAIASTGMPASSRARSAPTCAIPRAPPPLRTTATRGGPAGPGGIGASATGVAAGAGAVAAGGGGAGPPATGRSRRRRRGGRRCNKEGEGGSCRGLLLTPRVYAEDGAARSSAGEGRGAATRLLPPAPRWPRPPRRASTTRRARRARRALRQRGGRRGSSRAARAARTAPCRRRRRAGRCCS